MSVRLYTLHQHLHTLLRYGRASNLALSYEPAGSHASMQMVVADLGASHMSS